ncbi:MAG: lipolytic protein [Desulfobacterales bacterium]|nr:lipolytic protein [Desulfobacterales bacterium]MCP4159543.1 lipolytic protein [Deltaproteobacteria bacterium]
MFSSKKFILVTVKKIITGLILNIFMKNIVFYISLAILLFTTTPIIAEDFNETDVKVVVMFGDSITMGGKWDQLFNSDIIANEGLKSDMTSGFLDRMDDVYRHQPEIVFIMGGINDIAGGISPNSIFKNFKTIIRNLRRRGIIPVIQATLYSRKKAFNPSVERLNSLLVAYAEKNRIDYIDLNATLSTKKKLKRKYTFDGLHITQKAYLIWKKEIVKVLKKYNFSDFQYAKGRNSLKS